MSNQASSQSNQNPKFTTDVVIGLEIHAELNTKTKIFCGCPTKSGEVKYADNKDADYKGTDDRGTDKPNTRVCQVCLGMPGSKPVFNAKALEHALKLALACNCTIAASLVFSRKSYFYPDMSKNYQITQYELPLGRDGFIEAIGSNAGMTGKKVSITRIHLEEDPASLVHHGGIENSAYVLIDYNRSGNPLVEIVTGPDMSSAAEARDFMKALITILDYLEIFDVKDGIIKADANVSIREAGYTRVEVKNITGFKEIERALQYEISRQKTLARDGKKFSMETRSWNSDKGMTTQLRAKETEEDYGYIIDADLVKTNITTSMLTSAQLQLPELPKAKIARYVEDLGISQTDAEVISQDKHLAKIFEKASAQVYPALAAKWIRRELVRVANYNKTEISELKIDEGQFIALLKLLQSGAITDTTGQKLIEELAANPFDVDARVSKEGLGKVTDDSALQQACAETVKESPQAFDDYKKGAEKSLNFLVGIIMKKTKGKADAEKVKKILHSMAN